MSRHTYNKQGWTKKQNQPDSRRRSSSPKISSQIKKNLLLIIIACFVGFSLFAVILMAMISKDLPNPNSLTERSISQTTKIYDRTGTHVLYEIFGEENRTLKKLQQGFCNDKADIEFDEKGIPLFALQATIAAEDRSFCTHGGFDVRGLARAVFQNLIGNKVGGSTLTQQLVKNAILSNEKTFTRKIKELILSVELERRYKKDEILQIYFNEIPYGSTYYGIEAAAQNFYGKSANELSIAQAVTLASLPKAPTVYLNNPDRLLARRNYLLDQMLELNFITQEEHDTAFSEDTAIQSRLTNIEAPHFVLYVKDQLEETYGARAVEEGGMKVITTLDYDYQKIAEEEVKKGVDERGESKGFSNASLVAIDTKNGNILSMVGSKDYFSDEIDGQVNVATRPRQPGSSFKPIVYAKSFEMGYTPNTVLWDVETTMPTATGPYTPHDYDGKERGPIRLREALQGSLNIPAVKLLYLVGIENTLNFANSLGYTSFSELSNYGLSLALGGGEVKLVEHVNAFAAFANNGKQHDLVSILKVEDADGTILEEWKQQEGKQIIDENAAKTITHVLSDNSARTYVFGGTSMLQLGERPVAAKTGTTNDYRDGWLVGYTPSLAVGVWAGNNNNTEMKKGSGGENTAGPIWNAFFKRALEGKPIEQFAKPTIKATGKDVLDGKISAQTIMIDKATGKRATALTPDSQKEERLFAEYHEILHYVDPTNPTGPTPENPSKDPQYTAWEAGILKWIAKQEETTGIKITQSAPPTEEDNVHTPANTPRVEILSPTEGQTLNDRNLFVQVSAEAPRSVSRVELYIDGQFLDLDNSAPFSFSLVLPNTIKRGFHSLKAVAYDDVDNAGTDTVGITISQDGTSASLDLIDPKNGQVIERSQQTFTVVAQLKQPQDYASLTMFAQPLYGGARTLIGQVVDPSSPFITVDWSLPESGSWVLTATARTKNGSPDLTTTGVLVRIMPGQTPTPPVTEPPTENTTPPTTESPPDIYTPTDSLKLF